MGTGRKLHPITNVCQNCTRYEDHRCTLHDLPVSNVDTCPHIKYKRPYSHVILYEAAQYPPGLDLSKVPRRRRRSVPVSVETEPKPDRTPKALGGNRNFF